jgi:Tol biopolymer transport system component
MARSSGTRLGHYEIGAPLGAGGMGEVYRAHDTTLDRDVAIKVLPEALARDVERLARFKREAQVLASLNHPNIAHVYGFESATPADGSTAHFLAMELVEGEDLAARLKRGAIPSDEAIAIAKQLAEGLEEAHERGIVHRDLKPANVKVTREGKVKILDFGLAKAWAGEPASGASADLSQSPTLAHDGTRAGIILGTAAYMSPEQARGKPVDKRADIWSFGVVLFEMLTGTRLFAGETVSDTLAAVLKEEVPWSRLPADTPRALVHVLRRCLVRDPRDRLRDIGEARLALATPEPERALTEPGPRAAPPAGPRSLLWALAASTLGLAIALALVWAPWRGPALRGTTLRLTPFSFEPGGQTNPVWSPDRKAVAFAARQKETDPYQVYVRYLESPVAAPITHLAGGAVPIDWTSPGRIVFESDKSPAGLWSVSPVGGEPEPLLAIDGGWSASVSRDGTALAVVRFGDPGGWSIWVSSPPGTPLKAYEPAPFATPILVDKPMLRFSPDGRQILLIWRPRSDASEAWLAPYPADAAHPPRRVLERLPESGRTPTASWMPDNRHVVVSTTFSERASEQLYLADTVSGVFDLFSSGTAAYLFPAVSPDGSKLVFEEARSDADIVSVDLATAAVSPLITTERSEAMPAWAAREAALVYVSDRSGESEIWLHRPGQLDHPVVTPRDFPPGTTRFLNPTLSPDAARVIYGRRGRDGNHLWISALAGGAPVPLVKRGRDVEVEVDGSWSPDGKWYAYRKLFPVSSLNKVKTTGQAVPEVLKEKVDPRGGWLPVWSPAGDWILYDDQGVKLTSPDGKTTRPISSTSADAWAFSADGRTLYGIRKVVPERLELFSVSVAGGPEKTIGSLGLDDRPASQFPNLRLSLSPDGKTLAYSTLKETSNLWLMDGLDSVGSR